jgi:hypothetical protein
MYCALGHGKTNDNKLETFHIQELFCCYPFSCCVLLRFMEPHTHTFRCCGSWVFFCVWMKLPKRFYCFLRHIEEMFQFNCFVITNRLRLLTLRCSRNDRRAIIRKSFLLTTIQSVTYCRVTLNHETEILLLGLLVSVFCTDRCESWRIVPLKSLRIRTQLVVPMRPF